MCHIRSRAVRALVRELVTFRFLEKETGVMTCLLIERNRISNGVLLVFFFITLKPRVE